MLGKRRIAGITQMAIFFFSFSSFCKLKRRLLFFKLPSGPQTQTMQPCCGSVRHGAILFYTVPGRQAKSPVMVVRGLEVGIKLSLSACSVPLIRWLASAMQWARWESFLTVAEWKPLPLFCCNCTKQTNIQSNTKKVANGSGCNRIWLLCELCGGGGGKERVRTVIFNVVLLMPCFLIRYFAAVIYSGKSLFCCYFSWEKKWGS